MSKITKSFILASKLNQFFPLTTPIRWKWWLKPREIFLSGTWTRFLLPIKFFDMKIFWQNWMNVARLLSSHPFAPNICDTLIELLWQCDQMERNYATQAIIQALGNFFQKRAHNIGSISGDFSRRVKKFLHLYEDKAFVQQKK